MDKWLAKLREYEGVPYRPGGWNRAGVDCIGLLIGAAADVGVLPDLVRERMKKPREFLAQSSEMLRWIKTYFNHYQSELIPGVTLLYRIQGVLHHTHIAVYLGEGRMIHAMNGIGRVVVCGLPTTEESGRMMYFYPKPELFNE